MTLYRDNANPPVVVQPERQPLPAVAAAPEPWSFKTRDDFPELMNQWGLTKVGVEVGVYRGGFSTYILKHWEGVLHLVDPWEYQPGKRDMLNTVDAAENERLTRMAMQDHEANGRCVIHKGYSVEIARWLSSMDRPMAFDWVYIDALHDYESCLADMRAWAPLIRSGGALCGHDYLDHPPGGETDFGVVSAVRDWCKENGYNVATDVITTTHDGYPTWVIRPIHPDPKIAAQLRDISRRMRWPLRHLLAGRGPDGEPLPNPPDSAASASPPTDTTA